MKDVFCKNSEAGGQYYYPNQVAFLKNHNNHNKTKPNYHFDLCRLSMTILDEINETKFENKELFKLLKKMCLDTNNYDLCKLSDNFKLIYH